VDELVEVDIVANVEANVHRARIGRTHVVSRLSPAVSASHLLLHIAILQELKDHVVELHETDIQPLLAALEVRHSDGSRIDLSLPRQDLLIRECGPSNRLSTSRTPSDGAATVGATEAMAGRGHGTSTFDESKLDDEIAFLKTEIYLRDVEPRLQTLTAFDRFSVRA
jgi:hypothetical protein